MWDWRNGLDARKSSEVTAHICDRTFRHYIDCYEEDGLNGRIGPTVVLNAGIVSEENLHCLSEHGYCYLDVSRKRKRVFDTAQATRVKDLPRRLTVQVQRVVNEATGEFELHCHS